jgi:hypothetical protein
LQTIQIYRIFYVFHRFACDLNLSKIIEFSYGTQTCCIFCVSYLFECNANSYFHSISTQGKPVANFKFSTNLHGMQTYCKYHVFCRFAHASQTCCKCYICIGFTRESDLLQILHLHWVYTRGKPVANFMFALGLHPRQNCCKCRTCQRFAIDLHYTASRRMRDFRMPLRICKLEVYTRGKSGKSMQIRILLHYLLYICKSAN